VTVPGLLPTAAVVGVSFVGVTGVFLRKTPIKTDKKKVVKLVEILRDQLFKIPLPNLKRLARCVVGYHGNRKNPTSLQDKETATFVNVGYMRFGYIRRLEVMWPGGMCVMVRIVIKIIHDII